jgi:hypothetical protein
MYDGKPLYFYPRERASVEPRGGIEARGTVGNGDDL